jgi:hypothetical protein
MSGTAREVLTWAARQVGTLERPAGSNQQDYAELAGHADRQPWCATFIVAGWKKNRAAILPGTNTAWTPGMREGFRRASRLYSTPLPGDVGHVFYADLERIGHVFFVERVEGDFVRTIEGNTNTDGSRTGIGVFRHRRRWRNGGSIRGFGRPKYTAPGPTSRPPTVDVSNLVYAARHDPPAAQGATSYPADVKVVEAALLAEGLLSARYAKDGSFGSTTVRAYSQWQKELGFHGSDADGIPGRTSLVKLGQRHGFRVQG